MEKCLLEQELQQQAAQRDFSYTILRPVFIYGPYNYAPWESWYIRNMIAKKALSHPVDATGKFHMVYVKDVARAIHTSILDLHAKNNIYILSAPDIMTYDTFLQQLKNVSGCPVQTFPVTVQQVIKDHIPLPFPLTEEENELFDGQKIVRETNFIYESLNDAMHKTYRVFYDISRK